MAGLLGWHASQVLDFVIGRGCSNLAQVERAYQNAAEFWDELPPNLRQTKSTRRNRLGGCVSAESRLAVRRSL